MQVNDRPFFIGRIEIVDSHMLRIHVPGGTAHLGGRRIAALGAALESCVGKQTVSQVAQQHSISVPDLLRTLEALAGYGAVFAWELHSAVHAITSNPSVFPDPGERPSINRPKPISQLITQARRARSTRKFDGTGAPLKVHQRASLAALLVGQQDQVGGLAHPSAGNLGAIESVLSLQAPDGSGDHEITHFMKDCVDSRCWYGSMSLALGVYGADRLSAWVFLLANYEELGALYGPRAPRLAWIEAGAAVQSLYEWALTEHLAVLAYGGFDDQSLAAGLRLSGGTYPVIAVGLGVAFQTVSNPEAVIECGAAKIELTRVGTTSSAATVVRARIGSSGPAGFAAARDPAIAVEAAVSELAERTLTWQDVSRPDSTDKNSGEVSVELLKCSGDIEAVLRPAHWFTDRPLDSDVAIASAAQRCSNLALSAACVELVERLVLPVLSEDHVLSLKEMQSRAGASTWSTRTGSIVERAQRDGVRLLGGVAWGMHVIAVDAQQYGYLAAAARWSLTEAMDAALAEFEMLSIGTNRNEGGPRVGARLQAAVNECKPVALEMAADNVAPAAESLPMLLASALELVAYRRPSPIVLGRRLCRLAARDAR